ncbi:heavy metal-binding protein HIP-like isoform X2 [Mercenaria mercenaria]|uniref:heavy metal-binding protein HIP-like isoform X2 n=1 Tax=Mercenaria mercenaria TaxID=6596 RepID=UPI00234EBAA6|nr:heavy metal-binding protein HIP-like isoform X2 [Mercenaria mercenaria]
MKFSTFLFISFCFFQILWAEDIPSRKELEVYIQDLLEAKIRENVEARDLAHQKELEALQTRLNQAERRIKDLEQHESKIDALSVYTRNAMFASKRYLMNAGSPVGFMACVSVPDLVNLGDHHTILFDRAITNTGGAFHNHTGVFIAPFKGLYAFHLSAMSSPDKAQYLAFVKDGVVINHAYPDAVGTKTFQTAGSQWVVELDQGSEVWIQTFQPGEIHGNCFTVFSGFLLSEME